MCLHPVRGISFQFVPPLNYKLILQFSNSVEPDPYYPLSHLQFHNFNSIASHNSYKVVPAGVFGGNVMCSFNWPFTGVMPPFNIILPVMSITLYAAGAAEVSTLFG